MNLGIGTERITGVQCPALVHQHILDTIACGEIHKILVCIQIDTRLERHIRTIGNAIKPIPTGMSCLNPISITNGICRCQTHRHCVFDQLAVALRDKHIAPRERTCTTCPGNIVSLLQYLLTAVALILIFQRSPGLYYRKGIGSLAARTQEHAGIVKQVKLRNQHLLPLSHNQYWQFAHAVTSFPFATGHYRVELLATGLETARLLQYQLARCLQSPRSVLAHHLDVALQRRYETISHTVIIHTPFDLVPTGECEGKQGISVLHPA